MKVLERKQFGDPILRQKAKPVPIKSIKSVKIRNLIADMRHTLVTEKQGVALAAPQVGQSLAVVVVRVRPLPHRAKAKKLDLVLINPEIIQVAGVEKEMWEGCISAGTKDAGIFAKVPRHQTAIVKYYDEFGKLQQHKLTGLPAQIVQHETDHLQGVLFVDRVIDTKTYMTYTEYVKRIRSKESK